MATPTRERRVEGDGGRNGDDRIVVSYYPGSSGATPEVDVVQAGADAHLVVDGQTLAVLQNTDADEVGNIDLVARNSTTGAGSGSVVGGPAGSAVGGTVGSGGPVRVS